MTASAEIELKLETDAKGAAALKRHPLLKGLRAKTVKQATTYFDTPLGTLKKAGLSLRVRKANGGFVQTVKQHGGAGAGLFARPEWEWPVKELKPNLAALDETPAGELIDGEPLSPTVQSDARRSIWHIDRDGNAMELVLDEGRVSAGDHAETIAEVEIELKAGDAAALFGIGRDLASAAALRIGVLTKAERGQRLADGRAGKPAKAEPVRLSPRMTTAEGFAAIVHSCLRQFRLNEPLAAEQHDPGALHQARVAMRRLRSAFSLFRRVADDERYGALKAELRWLAGELGDARNLDVLLKRLDRHSEALRPRLEEAREAAYDRAVIALHSERLRLLMFDIVAWVETGSWRRGKRARRPLPRFAAKALDKRWNKVMSRAADLAKADPEARHQLRIEGKKLRYAGEFLASLQPAEDPRLKEFLASLEDLQEHLGQLNDRETARHLLGRLLKDRDPDLAAAAERLTGSGKVEQRSLRAAEKATGRLLAAGPYWR